MEEERIPTNLRTLMILEAIGAAEQPMTAAETGRVVGLPKQTIHRLCTSLVSEGFLAFAPDGKRLRPGRRARQMASGILHASRDHIARHQVLVELSEAVSETVNFVVPEDNGMHYQDRVEADWAFRVQLPVGTNVPFHCTASGKTFLASMSRSARRKMISNLTLERLTPNTFVDETALLEELEKISKQGYALDDEEFVEGMVAIAVPVHDPQGRYCASIAFHGPVQRLSSKIAISKIEMLKAAATKLTKTLFS